MGMKCDYVFRGLSLTGIYGNIKHIRLRPNRPAVGTLELFATPEVGASFEIVLFEFEYDPDAGTSLNEQAYVAAYVQPHISNPERWDPEVEEA